MEKIIRLRVKCACVWLLFITTPWIFSRAEEWYRKAYCILKNCPPTDSRHEYLLSTVLWKLARSCRYQGDYEAALKMLDEAVVRMERFRDSTRIRELPLQDGDWQIEYQYLLIDQAKCYLKQGKSREAEENCRRGMVEIQKRQDTSYRETNSTACWRRFIWRREG